MVDLSGKKILVTGGTGFVGGRLVERLSLECHADVRVLVHRWASAAWAARTPAELVQGDISDLDSLRAAANGCEIVFHCASGGNDHESYKEAIVGGTRNVLEASLQEGVGRVVHVSSFVVHGLEVDGEREESSPFVPSGHPYTEAKIAAETVVQEFREQHGLPIAVIRPTFVWGPRGAQFTVRLVRNIGNGSFTLYDDGEAECPAVYIDNLVDALLLASVCERAVGEAFLITDGEGLLWRDLINGYAAMLGVGSLRSVKSDALWLRGGGALLDKIDESLARLSGNPAPLWRRVIRRSLRETGLWLSRRGVANRRSVTIFSRRGGVNINKARRMLGYEPRVNLTTALSETETWLRDQFPFVMNSEAS